MPNILASPRFWNKKNVALKKETTYATDATPTGAANWFEARNVALTSLDTETVSRDIDLGFFGNAGDIVVAKWSSLSFDIALTSSGTLGTAAKWASALLACATAETVNAGVSVAYNLASSALASVSAYLEIDGVVYKFIGARGNPKVSVPAKGLPMLHVELWAPFAVPAAGSIASISKTGWLQEEAVNAVNSGFITINAINLAFSKLDYDLGNQLKKVNLPGPQVEVMVVDRDPSASATVLAPAIGTFDPYALADANTVIAVTQTHGSAGTKKIKSDLNVRITNVNEVEIEGMLGYDLTFKPTPVTGNDEIAITIL